MCRFSRPGPGGQQRAVENGGPRCAWLPVMEHDPEKQEPSAGMCLTARVRVCVHVRRYVLQG